MGQLTPHAPALMLSGALFVVELTLFLAVARKLLKVFNVALLSLLAFLAAVGFTTTTSDSKTPGLARVWSSRTPSHDLDGLLMAIEPLHDHDPEEWVGRVFRVVLPTRLRHTWDEASDPFKVLKPGTCVRILGVMDPRVTGRRRDKDNRWVKWRVAAPFIWVDAIEVSCDD